jgi:hypothetical protein
MLQLVHWQSTGEKMPAENLQNDGSLQPKSLQLCANANYAYAKEYRTAP